MMQGRHDSPRPRQRDANQSTPHRNALSAGNVPPTKFRVEPEIQICVRPSKTTSTLITVKRPTANSANQKENAQTEDESSTIVDTGVGPSDQGQNPMKKKQQDKVETLYHESTSTVVKIPFCLLKDVSKLQQSHGSTSVTSSSKSSETSTSSSALDLITPPITKDTLKELELSSIQNNLTLRIDLVYDQGLYFQPISGSRGQEKLQLAKAYWESLALELKAYLHELRGDCGVCGSQDSTGHSSRPSRLHKLFSVLRELLGMLVPEAERAEVESRLDVDFYVRLVRTGQFEAASFAQWLSKLITTHCAPMRDQMARDMQRKIAAGAEAADMDVLVSGLRLLFSLLEKMKLDVANHQIRTFKYPLITDAVPFQQDCYHKLIQSNQFDLSTSTSWFQRTLTLFKKQNQTSDMALHDLYFEAFVQGVVGLARTNMEKLPATFFGDQESTGDRTEELPAIFAYDRDRLEALRNDITDIVHWQICEKTLRDLMQEVRHRQPTRVEIEQYSERVLQLIMPDGSHNESIECHLESVAYEIARVSAGIDIKDIIAAPELCGNVNHFKETQNRLESNLQDCSAATEQQLVQNLNELVLQHAYRFNKMGTLQVSDEQKAWAEERSRSESPRIADLEYIARRIAHIAVLTWQVWADMAFLDVHDPVLTEP